ncbi:hypothetical protein G3I15_41840 [Streptomyces sp. SID10244]|nr:hypothetical protein [Streptomyces sp. SID10244]
MRRIIAQRHDPVVVANVDDLQLVGDQLGLVDRDRPDVVQVWVTVAR